MNLKKDADQKWFTGGFPIDDHEIVNVGSIEINPSDYIDLTPSGDTLELIPDFGLNATDEEKSGMR